VTAEQIFAMPLGPEREKRMADLMATMKTAGDCAAEFIDPKYYWAVDITVFDWVEENKYPYKRWSNKIKLHFKMRFL